MDETQLNSPQTPRKWISEFDSLRGMAALAVVVVHYFGAQGLFDPDARSIYRLFSDFCVANVAVLMFYLLSAFLLTFLAFRSTKPFSIGRFYQRRTARIWPLYFVLVILVLGILPFLVGNTTFFPVDNDNIIWCQRNLFWFCTFTGNWPLVGALVYSGEVKIPAQLGILWSIAVEEQFYLVFPWLVLAVQKGRLGHHSLAIMALIGGICSRSLMVFHHPAGGGIYYATTTYLETFCFGAIAGWLAANGHCTKLVGSRWPLMLLPATCGLCYCWHFCLWPPYDQFGLASKLFAIVIYPVMSLLLAIMLLWVYYNSQSWICRILQLRPLRFLGLISFGMYVWHILLQPVSMAITEVFLDRKAIANNPHLIIPLAAFHVSLCIIVATLSYLIVERPVLWLTRHQSVVQRDVEEQSMNRWLWWAPSYGTLTAVMAFLVIILVSLHWHNWNGALASPPERDDFFPITLSISSK